MFAVGDGRDVDGNVGERLRDRLDVDGDADADFHVLIGNVRPDGGRGNEIDRLVEGAAALRDIDGRCADSDAVIVERLDDVRGTGDFNRAFAEDFDGVGLDRSDKLFYVNDSDDMSIHLQNYKILLRIRGPEVILIIFF